MLTAEPHEEDIERKHDRSPRKQAMKRCRYALGMFVGVDGFKGGWIAIGISTRGFKEARAFATFAELMSEYAKAKIIAVDMPLVLVARGDREADSAARAYLKGQASSVFNAPPKPVLTASDYPDAARIARTLTGKGMSKQSFHLIEKIKEVQPFVPDERVFEVHPEISFRIMNGGDKLPRKKSWAGMRARLRLLAENKIVLPDELGDAGKVPIDDVVDAAGAAFSARRIKRGKARMFPETTSQKDRKRFCAIFA